MIIATASAIVGRLFYSRTSHTQQLLLLRRLVNSLDPGAPRASPLNQHDVGRDQEGGGAVQLLHRGPSDHPPFLARPPPQLLYDCVDGRPYDKPRARRLANTRNRLGRHLPAGGRSCLSHTLPDRAQPMVDDLLILIAHQCEGALNPSV